MKKISRVDGGISAIVEEDPPKEISSDPSLTNDENFIWKGRRRRNLALKGEGSLQMKRLVS